MSEEMTADSGEVSEPSVESSEFNMEDAVTSISEDIFGKSKPEESEEELDEVEQAIKEEIKAAPKEEKQEEEKIDLPPSWKKDMEDKWSKLDPDTKKYVLQREDQMRQGLEKDRGDANLGRTMRDLMTPHAQILKQQGIEAPQAFNYLMNVHAKLSSGTPEQKKAFLNEVAKSYGIGEVEGDPQVISLQQRLEAMERNLSASHQRSLQESRTRIEAEVSTFAESHPHFDDLSDDIAKFVTAGYDLEEAYEKALWGNPATRQTEIDRIEKERRVEAEKKAKQEADEAKKAKSVNVRGRDTEKAPTAKTGTMEDTLRETFRKIQTR